MPAIAEQAIICPVCCSTSDGYHRNIVNQEHDYCKNRQTQEPVGNDLIDLIRCGHANLFLLQAVLNNGSNINIPFIGDNAFCIIVHFFFGRFNIAFNVGQSALVNLELFQNLFIPFKYLDCIPSLLFFRHAVQGSFFDVCNGMFYTAAKLVLRNHCLLLLCNFNCLFRSFLDTSTLQCRNFYNLAAQFFCKLCGANLVAALPNDVHHVDGYNNRNAQFYQLCGQVQISFQVCTINDVQNRIRTFIDQIISGNDFFQCVRRKGINTRQVGDDNITMPFQFTFLLFDCNPRPVTNELIGTRQCIKQCRFTTVWVTCQRNFNTHLSTFLSFQPYFVQTVSIISASAFRRESS